jgi:hypothetical protein
MNRNELGNEGMGFGFYIGKCCERAIGEAGAGKGS